jgi:hypothetical protein
MEEKKSRGRPPAPPDEKLVLRSIRLTRPHWAKIDAAGMEAFREYIARWRPKPKDQASSKK